MHLCISYCFISSPEQKVLKISYCDQSISVMCLALSVLRRLSCGVNNLL